MTSEELFEPPLSVLVVVTSSQRRGAEIEGTELAEQLQALGVSAVAVALAPSDAVTRLPIVSLGPSTLGVRTLRALRRRAHDVDVVIAYGSNTLTACALALAGTRTPFVYRSIGDPRRWVRGRLHRRIWAVLYRRASRVVALWPEGAKSVCELFGVDAERVQLIPNARDHTAFVPATSDERAAARRRLDLSIDAKVVAVVGSLSEEKQVDRAIEAVALLPAIELLLVGDGPLRCDLEIVAELVAPGRVRFLGQVDDVNDVLAAIDVLVLTSRTEGMPGAVIEAGMSGVPTVAPPIGALETLIDHEATGVIAASSAPDDVARAIEELLPIAGAAGDAARVRMVDEFSWSAVASRWLQFLSAVNTPSGR